MEASLPDVDHGDDTSLKGILIVYVIFFISLDMLVGHHHCWKHAHFLMFRVSVYSGMHSMKIINVKNKS